MQHVRGHRALAEITRTADRLAADADDSDAERLLSQIDSTRREWTAQTMPAIAASMQLALEVYDTFGPGTTVVDNPTDAAIWNNKWFVAEHDHRGRALRRVRRPGGHTAAFPDYSPGIHTTLASPDAQRTAY